MNALVKISDRGQLTLPAAIRRSLGIGPGDTLQARIEDGRLILEPVAVVPVELYTAERIEEFGRNADLSKEELRLARDKWQIDD